MHARSRDVEGDRVQARIAPRGVARRVGVGVGRGDRLAERHHAVVGDGVSGPGYGDCREQASLLQSLDVRQAETPPASRVSSMSRQFVVSHVQISE